MPALPNEICKGLKSEFCFNRIYEIELLPGKEFNFDFFLFAIGTFECLLNDFILTSHVTICRCFGIDRVAEFQALLDCVWAQVENFAYFRRNSCCAA